MATSSAGDKPLKSVRIMFEKLKNLISRNFIIWVGLLIVFALVYYGGSVQIHQVVLNALPKISFDFSSLSSLAQVAPTPTPTFLSDIAAFESAIVAFLVPLSIEIITKMSERYGTDVITSTFERDRWNKSLPLLLLINIAWVIVLRFFVPDNVNSVIWKIVSWIILIFFLFIVIVVWRVINHIKTFMSDSGFIIHELYKDVEDALE